MKYFIFIFLISFNTFAFTLNPSTARGYDSNSIDIHTANNDCSAVGFDQYKLAKMVSNAVDTYWNQVPTSALYLNSKGVNTSIDIDGDQFSDALNKVPENTIVAGCNDDVTSFANSSTLGAAVMDCNGGVCRAVLILNSHSTSPLIGKSQSDIEAVIAHEIGHAFGLGHSEYEYNLMYYAAGGKNQKWLGMDDIDGVTYLYPHDAKLAGLLGSCGTIEDINNNNKNNISFIFQFLIGFLIVFLLIKLRPSFLQHDYKD